MNSYRWPALPVVIILIMTTCLSLLLLPLSVNGEASSSYQRCQVDTNCTLGEYVFDNEGQPISNQICIIDIRNPSGELIVNDAMMITTPDGWHSYTVNLPSPTGLYRALMYCNNAGDVGYLDKSFILGTTFEDINGNINDLGTTVGGIGSDVTDLGTSISDIGSDVTGLGTSVGDISTQISNLGY
ncbi:MAG: hypothetical protein PHG63_02965, partial [Candidatus Dojkabacteria bacterium]|nr:hypothetical protein [Candidatus Dojkabacteria bacterium]